MTAMSAIIIHIFKQNCGSHVMRFFLWEQWSMMHTYFDVKADTAGFGGRMVHSLACLNNSYCKNHSCIEVLMSCEGISTTVTNPVHGLPLTHHQRSLAHHMDSCPTLIVALHLRLQFPSSIALTTHTADCTDHTADCTDHRLYMSIALPICHHRVLFSV